MTVRRPLATLFVVPVLAVGLSGCGVSETSFRPGVAAEIGEERITTAEVDEVADGLCGVLRSDLSFDGRYYRNSTLRNAALRGLALDRMSDQIAEEYGVTLPDTADFGAGQVQLQFAQADRADLEAAMPAFTGDSKLREVLVALGREELGAKADETEAITAGVEKAQAWQEGVDIDTNPAYDSITIGESSVEVARDDLSVAASDFALDAIDPASQEAGSNLKDVPESQRCTG